MSTGVPDPVMEARGWLARCLSMEVYWGGASHARLKRERVTGRMCASCRVKARHAPARLVHSWAIALLEDVGLGRRCRRDGRLHDLGGVGDLGAAHELGVLPTGWVHG